MQTRAHRALAGLTATVLGMAAGHLVAALSNPSSSPLLAVGSAIIDLTPTPLKEWAITQFGTHDKQVLLGSVALVTLALAAVAGLLAARGLRYAAGLLLLLVAAAGVAVMTRPGAVVGDLLPAAVAGAVGVGALVVLTHGADRTGTAPGGRRGFLLGGAALLLAAAAGSAGQAIIRARTTIANIVLPRPRTPLPPLPPGLELTRPGISPLRTLNSSFYRVDTRLSLPVIDLPSWKLTVDGDVQREVSFSYDDLLAMPLVEKDITLTCVSNSVGGHYLGSARWLGIPLRTLLDSAGLDRTRADQILSTDVDGMTISTPLGVALDGRDALLAIGMNGEPLPLEHGFPARLVVPGLYGFVSATKWIRRMTLTTYAAQQAYWTKRSWATDAPVRISSRIDTPAPLGRLRAGVTFIGGIAWAQHVGIRGVEVQVDGGAWQRATLGPDVGVDYWRQWFLPWDARPGSHTLAVRATGLDGTVQTAARATPFPSGASGIQQLVVSVS